MCAAKRASTESSSSATKFAAASLGALVVGLGAVVATASTMVARAVVTPPRRRKDPVRLLGVDKQAGTVTLARTPETAAPGHYSLVFAAETGRANVGAVVDESERTVTRRFWGEQGAQLERVRSVRLASAPQLWVRDLNLPWRWVDVQTPLGAMPAWLIPAAQASDSWAIHVHGRGAVMTEPLRAVPLFRGRGWNSLVVSYRNDALAPPSPDGKFGLGATEWRDVESAMDWAVSRGARRIILVGWSMGGGTVIQAALNARHRELIAGIFLESPALSWRSILRYQGSAMRLPRIVTALGIWLIGSPLARPLLGLEAPIPLSKLEILDRLAELTVPILLFHSSGDTVVPVDASRELARRRPDLVTYREFERALHTRLWNVDSGRWEQSLDEWLATF
ncbi:alpha/beta hydrolase [Pseudoclavibacter sp. RFBJ3]|uniref:alpha/beta hydrolase n=1 Tax=unclassified Pseudoclavibacter TaxID=2615177 RepID=UPI000CE7CE90|nr:MULTISPECIES: alpha/beta fold hydrolase [unclassified Pseudoclavibacter]PPF84984.1 alpha/beta hydrolase [Pseudoclavibacter sp. RFBJ5]PPF93988.1 alpha/beta hydrolase [Pseudoclavibacter sp. RFBJ3]PPF98705.1 alpha/beta hydrolase [Pseudoclavibacter sp. RFBH5]PPG24334.1 alpha/beta hydrolase [Pseudoclavibacter sp. RFBI4]